MNIIKKYINEICDFPKSAYLNIKVFGFRQGIKLPIRVRYNVKLYKISRGSINIESNVSKYMIYLGDSGAPFIHSKRSHLYIGEDSKIIFKGKCNIAEGFSIFVNKGQLEFGQEIYSNKNLCIQCEEEIKIGNNVLIGWDVNIRDTDGHEIIVNDTSKSIKEKIEIRDKVWLASQTTILKGSYITKGSVVGCNSLVCGLRMDKKNSLVVGVPAKIKKENILWKL